LRPAGYWPRLAVPIAFCKGASYAVFTLADKSHFYASLKGNGRGYSGESVVNLCICCDSLTFDHCRECSVPVCWTCGASGLCGICMRMEVYRKEHRLSLRGPLLSSALILKEGFDPWSANIAVKKACEETELLEAKK